MSMFNRKSFGWKRIFHLKYTCISCIIFGILMFFSLSLSFLSFSTDSLIQQISAQKVLEVKSEWTEDFQESKYSSIQFDFRVTCDAHYYGQGCANLCRPRDDQFGHYTCSTSGSIVCLSGWQGDYCTKGKSKRFVFFLYLNTTHNTK